MPNFRALPYRVQGHKVRYEDVHLPDPDQPDWMQEAVDSGAVVPDAQQECLLVRMPSGSMVAARYSKDEWVLHREDDTLSVVNGEHLARDFEVIP